MKTKPVDLTGIDVAKVDPEWLRLRETASRTDLFALMVHPCMIVNLIDAALDGMRFKRMPKQEQPE